MSTLIFVHLWDDYSGSPRVLAEVIQSCEGESHEVCVYAGSGSKGILAQTVTNYESYPYRRSGNRLLTLVSFLYSQLHLFFVLLKYRGQDVTFYINTLLPFGAALAGALMGKKVLFHVHEVSITPPLLKAFLRRVVTVTANRVAFVSAFSAKQETFGTLPESVIENVLPEPFSSIAMLNEYSHMRDNSFRVLMACSLRAYKGVEEFLEIAELCSQLPQIQFTLIVNAPGVEVDDFQRQQKIPANFQLVDQQPDLGPFYAATSLVVNLSRPDEWIETFGLTLLEAMAYGVPVIAPPVGGPTELVTDGVEGFLMSSRDTGAIAQRVAELAADESRCLMLSKNARAKAQCYNPEIFRQRVQDFIDG